MMTLNPDETLVLSEEDCTAGTIGSFGPGVNDAYDLYLLRNPDGNYTLVLFMKVQFFFEDDPPFRWTESEKNHYVETWKRIINNHWGNNRTIRWLPSGKHVRFDIRFEAQIDGIMLDHWEITVRKVGVGDFPSSCVYPDLGNVYLDSNDLLGTNKTADPLMIQRDAVHEFGHMIGLPDEYNDPAGAHYADTASVMNLGEEIRLRHETHFLQWLNQAIRNRVIS